MAKQRTYSVMVKWTGNTGSGTSSYGDYDRSHEISAEGKPVIAASSDPVFSGDRERWNPEELLVASLSSCHQLWYLHLCAEAGIVVLEYVDNAQGVMGETPDGGRFTGVLLRPRVKIAADGNIALANELHHRAHALCFIANSVNFPVNYEAEIVTD